MDNLCKIFSIHFPGKKVYIENTFKSINDKMEEIKNNEDHQLYSMLKECLNPETRVECFKEYPEIRVECYRDLLCDKKSVASKYLKDNYKILNVNVLPYNYKPNI